MTKDKTRTTSPTLPKEISWKASSHKKQSHSAGWYLGFLILTVAACIFALWYSHSIITLITFILIALVVLILSSQPERGVTYKISADGLSANQTNYPFKTVKTFWIDYRPPQIKTLNFQTTAYLNNRVIFQLGDEDPLAVRKVLKQYILEDLDHADSLSETLAKNLKI